MAKYNNTNMKSNNINRPITKEIRVLVKIREIPIISINEPVVKWAKCLWNILFSLIFSYVNAKVPKHAITAIIDTATRTLPADALSVTRLLSIK